MRGPQHEFCAKMKFPAQKNKNSSVNGTTSLAVIVGPKCLIAHLLAPHDRAFSPWELRGRGRGNSSSRFLTSRFNS